MKIATVNVNGIRAAMRKGMQEWLATSQPDIVTMQEVRAPDDLVAPLLGDGWFVHHAESSAKGRAGVAIASRIAPKETRTGILHERFGDTGRWVEADFDTSAGPLTVISAYVHTGNENDDAKMADKYAFLDATFDRIVKIKEAGNHLVLTGDLNVAHKEVDIKNWKGNQKKAGFLPQERAYFDRLFGEMGFVDLGRRLGGDGPGPYTWWSNRGQAFDNDSGWRIDYQVVNPELADFATAARVEKALTWDTRWSDHAPLVVDYSL